MNETSHYAEVNGITLHYRSINAGAKHTMLVLHGLTANCHAFDGLLACGIADECHLIIPDLRGRGQSSAPAFNYTVQDHAEDIVALLDTLQLQEVILMGHSFGGLLSSYIADCHKERVSQVFLLDAAALMNPKTPEMLGPALMRLDLHYKDFEEYLAAIKQAPYLEDNGWDDAMLSYYQADVKPWGEGGVTPIPNLTNILEVSQSVGLTPWTEIFSAITQPVLLCYGVDDYNLGMPILPEERAIESAALLRHGKYIPVKGNHLTMLYGRGAQQIVEGFKAHFIA